MTSTKNKALAEFAHDIQTALPRHDVPELGEIKEIGMAATLAVHLRGLPEIGYEVLRLVSDHFFNIPSIGLKVVLPILAEIEFIEIIGPANNPKSIIPNVPFFEDIYSTLGDYSSSRTLSEHEQAAIAILAQLFESPHNKDSLRNSLGIDASVFERCLTIFKAGHLAEEKRARGRDIVISPLYFADNLSGLADAAAAGHSSEIQRVIELIRTHQGWPLNLITSTAEIGGHRLSRDELQIVHVLSEDLLLKPPSIGTRDNKPINFIFTPRPGQARLNASNREIFERAMAIVSSARKGQLLPERYRIRSPRALLQALKDRGRLAPNSEAMLQYKQLVEMRVGKLIPSSGDKAAFHLLQSEENERALDLAIQLVSTGQMSGMEVSNEARIAMQKDEKYIHHLISATELKQRETIEIDEDIRQAAEQLIFGF